MPRKTVKFESLLEFISIKWVKNRIRNFREKMHANKAQNIQYKATVEANEEVMKARMA